MPTSIPFDEDNIQITMKGDIGKQLNDLTDQWLLIAPLANPAMLEMFRDRSSAPLRDLVPWAGEFAGKYLTSAVEVLRLTNDKRLKALLRDFVSQLGRLQDHDGYLGPWRDDEKLTGLAKNAMSGITWDVWGHYHLIIGLISWYLLSKDDQALEIAQKIGNLLCNHFLDKKEGNRLVDTGSTEMNLSAIHGLCLLYQVTQQQQYYDLAEQIVTEFEALDNEGKPLAGDYYRLGLQNTPFYQTPKPRWESLHPIMGLSELYHITGKGNYRRAFENLWWSMLEFDIHNNGGFTSGERATGNPYDQKAIETCCTIAWMAMSVEMLKLTGNPIVADILEIATVNQIAGTFTPTGRWSTYNTPMNGVRKANTDAINFQSRPGSPELNCCSVNAPRGWGLLSKWAVSQDDDGLFVNWYGPSEYKTTIKHTTTVITLKGNYPASNKVNIDIEPDSPEGFTLNLRIPQWSQKTVVLLNGHVIEQTSPGIYLPIHRKWQKGDTIELNFDFTFHTWQGEKECKGLTSVYRGPVLLAYDHRYNLHHDNHNLTLEEWFYDPNFQPALDLSGELEEVPWEDWFPPTLLFKTKSADGQEAFLCDYGSAGVTGTPYRSWIQTKTSSETKKFDREHPLRTNSAE